MCDFEEFIFTCGHSTFRLKSYCHFARNHPQHACRRVKKLRNCWDQGRPCDACAAEAEAAAAAEAERWRVMQMEMAMMAGMEQLDEKPPGLA
ncbi:hypothetical protein C8A05DRAFT_29978 [Staphylotrichum tortipilum]|uniref:Uncharacterized protein n=1 Tax=Staphylotrichum tortipilum TaxID=2831512 RepID=A0AAN6MV34_9PEZI|nr:hypothetical protein C8A05DRAFT_29978 [Staphylotrichum longicolle]